MFLEPIKEFWKSIRGLKPAFISKHPHFSFITIHYFWIIGMVIIGSIIIFPIGNLAYIDALFFASGACTQSGLNTVDVNLLFTYQQLVLFFLPMLTNPIVINTFVVFLRLYWFEKRFQHVAREARKQRRSMSKSRSQMKAERDMDREERGVNGRKITVMRNLPRHNSMANKNAVPQSNELHVKKTRSGQEMDSPHLEKPDSLKESESSGNGESSHSDPNLHIDEASAPSPPQSPQIKFAEQVKRSDGLDDEYLRMPTPRTQQEHIAVLERQRNPEKGVLRIPGPRESERGMAPETVEEDQLSEHALSRRSSMVDPTQVATHESTRRDSDDIDRIDHARTRNITIEEPIRIQDHVTEDTRAAINTLNIFRLRKPRILRGKKLHEDPPQHFTKQRSRSNTFSSMTRAWSRERDQTMPYLSWEPTVGRNSAFVDLTEAQREELGGIEYRSLKTLALILVLYWWGFMILGIISLVPWIHGVQYWASIVQSDGQNTTWWGFFTASSAFHDVGFTLTPDSLISFQSAIWPLLLMSFLIIIGNTGFPIMLRFIIWVTSNYVPRGSGVWEELQFLLDHPRRCFTLLFPSNATWWLFWILVILNGVDLIFFIILDLGNTIVTALPVNIRVLDGWFQAVSTRTAGFAVVNLAELHPAIQVSYLIMMYISVLPIAISVRRTNVYEEKSLGIWGTAAEENQDENEPSYVGAHLRRQLSFDLWYIFLGFFVITIAEGPQLQSGDPAFTMFAVLFEVVSAYGTVGLSLGYTNINASFSAEFGTISKLVIIAMQIRGRHRGLPYELDRAILLPSESLHEKENNDPLVRRRRSSFHSADTGQRGDATGGRARSRSREPSKAGHILTSLLYPGPTIPNSHRVHLGLEDAQSHLRNSVTSVKRAMTHDPNTEHNRRSAEDNDAEADGHGFEGPKKTMSA